MVECVECDKKLGFLGGYRHPALGKNYLLCSSCYDNVYASVEKWREFISPYIGFFNNGTSHDIKRFNIVDVPKKLAYGLKMFEGFRTEKEI